MTKVTYGLLVNTFEIPLNEDELEKARNAMVAGEGVLILKDAVVRADKIIAIIPHYTILSDNSPRSNEPRRISEFIPKIDTDGKVVMKEIINIVPPEV